MPWEKQFDIEGGLDKAMQVFWAHGYEATSIQDLVDSMGINRGSLYGTYGDKRELFLAALHRYDETIRRQTLADLEKKFKPRQAIRGLFEAFAEPASGQRPARGCFLTNCALELAPHDVEVRKIIANAQKQTEAFFERMIKKGKASGEIAKEIRAINAARGLLASLLGMIVLTRSRPEKALIRSIIDDAMNQLG